MRSVGSYTTLGDRSRAKTFITAERPFTLKSHLIGIRLTVVTEVQLASDEIRVPKALGVVQHRDHGRGQTKYADVFWSRHRQR
jgi:hypothetical protein